MADGAKPASTSSSASASTDPTNTRPIVRKGSLYGSVTIDVRNIKYIIIACAVVLWVVAGLISFLMSIWCMGYSGSRGEQVAGLIIAIVFGPVFWLYFVLRKTYCR